MTAPLHKPTLERVQLFVAIVTAIAMLYIAYNQLCIARENHALRKKGM